MLTPLPSYPTENPSSLDFYATKELWLKKNQGVEFVEGASRTFTTITTSGNKCRFFNQNGEEFTREKFETLFNNYSWETFIVIMNKDSGEFLIKPSAWKIRELWMVVVRKVKKLQRKAA